MNGMILDIHRSSMDDGPGIRTTVFLKGCPLQCAWCHNPESISGKPELAFFEDKCMLCGDCVEVCPNNVHSIVNDKHLLDRTKCEICGKCVEACMQDALKISGKEMSVDEVMEIVLKDVSYYNSSGGGLTVSGGEPMYQFDFTLNLLQGAKSKNIHTCLDTSGVASKNMYGKILPFVDLFLFDYKASDNEKHFELTRVSNKLIWENFNFLYEKGASIALRCPIIPGVNDNENHLQNLSRIKKEYPKLKSITIMPYHNTGNSKYQRFGYENPLPGIKNPSDELIQRWNSYLEESTF